MATPDDLLDDVDDNLVEEHQRNIVRARAEREAVTSGLRSTARASFQRRADGPAPNADPPGASPSPAESDPNEGGVIDTLQDVGGQTLGGIFDGLDAILQLPYDLAGSDEQVDIFPNVDPSENVSGQIARGIGQLLPGILPGVGVVRTLSAASKGVKALQSARAALGTGVLKSGAKGAITYGVADFAAFDGNEGRLTDMLAEIATDYPTVNNLVFDYLRSDPEDTAVEGRFKNALEGLMIGGVADFALHGISKAAQNLRWSNWRSGQLAEAGVDGFTIKRVREGEGNLSFLGDVIEEVEAVRLHLRGGADEVPAGGADEGVVPTLHGSNTLFDNVSLESAREGDDATVHGWGINLEARKGPDGNLVTKTDFGKHTYQVDVNAPDGKLLDHEKPLTEQHPDIQAAFERLKAKYPEWEDVASEWSSKGDPLNGRGAYWVLQQIHGLSSGLEQGAARKAASLELMSEGVSGAKYSATGGADGFVIWDEGVLTTVSRDGVPTPRAEATAEPWQMTREEFATPVPLPVAKPGNIVLYHRLSSPDHLESVMSEGLDISKKRPGGEGPTNVIWAVTTPSGYTDAGTIIGFEVPKSDARSAGTDQFMVPRSILPREIVYVDKEHSLGGGYGPKRVNEQRNSENAERIHEVYIEKALAEGKPVPPEVLAEYPDLAPTPRAEAPGGTIADLDPTPGAAPNTTPANALQRLEAINPDLARRARAGLEEVDKLLEEARDLMEEATDDWVTLRTTDEGALLKDEEWSWFDERAGRFLTPEQLERVEAHKKIPPSLRQERLQLAREGKEADQVRRTREERTVNARDLMINPNAFSKRLNMDKTKWNEFKAAIQEQDAIKVYQIAQREGVILEADFPDEGQSWDDFIKTRYKKEYDVIAGRAVERLAKSADNSRQPKTGKESDKKFKDVKKGANKRLNKLKQDMNDSKYLPEEATPESILEFGKAMNGIFDVNDAPEILQLMEKVQLSMRASWLQRADQIKNLQADDLAKAEFDQLGEQLALVSDALRGNVTRFAQTLVSRRISPTARATNVWFADLRTHMGETMRSDKDRVKHATMALADADERTITRLLTKMHEKGLKDYLVEFYTNSILSGPITLAIQPISNTMMTLYMPLEAIAGASLRLDLQGVKTEMAAFRGLMETFKGMVKMTGKLSGDSAAPVQVNGANVLENTWKTLKSGSGTLDARTALDDSAQAITAGNFGFQDKTIAGSLANAFGNIVRMPGRMIATADEVGKGFNYNMKLSRDGYEDAVANGIADIDGHVREYMRQANDWRNVQHKELSQIWKHRHEQALQYARTATFQQDLTGGVAKSIQSFTTKHPMMKLVVPFVRTPANILKFVGQRTPVLHRISQDVRDDLAAGGVKAQAVHDRMNVATALWSTSMLMVHQGIVTGGGPSDIKERQKWFDAGWQPYSLWAGENEDGTQNWISFQRADPLGMFMGLSADLATAFTQMDDGDPEIGELAAAGMFALMNNIKSHSYFMGISSLMNAMDNPERFAQRYAQNQLANIIPNLSNQIRKYGPVGGDDAMYEVDGLMETLANRIPGYDHNLKPKRNVYGEIQRYPIGASMAIINPFYSADNGISPEMLKGLRRGDIDPRTLSPEQQVAAAAIKVNYSYSMKGYDTMKKVELTPDQRDFWIVETGRGLKEQLQTLVTSPAWKNLGDPVPGAEQESGKYKAFSRVIARKKRMARLATIRAFPELQSSLIAREKEKRARLLNRPDAVLAGGN